MQSIVYLEDKLGVSSGYERIFEYLLIGARIADVPVYRFNIHRRYPKYQWLSHLANRKAPTWNPKQITTMRAVVEGFIRDHSASLVICADPATLGLLGISQEMATLDKLRGGVYHPKIGTDAPWLVTLPVSAWHRRVKEKDLAAVNKGFTDKEEFEESVSHGADRSADEDNTDSDSGAAEQSDNELVSDVAESGDGEGDTELYYEPVVVPYGRFVLSADMRKAGRLIRAARTTIEAPEAESETAPK